MLLNWKKKKKAVRCHIHLSVTTKNVKTILQTNIHPGLYHLSVSLEFLGLFSNHGSFFFFFYLPGSHTKILQRGLGTSLRDFIAFMATGG